MNAIEQKILAFGDLPAAEQQELETYVRQHPEWAPLLADTRALHSLLEATHAPAGPTTDDLAAYVFAEATGSDSAPDAKDVITEKLKSDPEVAREVRLLRRRLDTIAADTADPVDHFERLTGRTLHTDSAPAKRAEPGRVLAWRPLRFALAASLALAALYGLLALANQATQPERTLLADLSATPALYDNMRLRGGESPSDPAEGYGQAREMLLGARSSFLGLFPSYDADELERAARSFRALADEFEPDTWEGSEALYTFGRIRLYQGRDEEAAQAFRLVVTHNGPHALDAQRLLSAIDRL